MGILFIIISLLVFCYEPFALVMKLIGFWWFILLHVLHFYFHSLLDSGLIIMPCRGMT